MLKLSRTARCKRVCRRCKVDRIIRNMKKMKELRGSTRRFDYPMQHPSRFGEGFKINR